MATGSLLLLALTFVFGALDVSPSPKSPAAAVVASWAPERPDYLLYLDTAAVIPHAWDELQALRKHALVLSNPEIRSGFDSVVGELEQGVALIQQQSGVNVVSDIDWVAAWITFPGAEAPTFLVTVGGRFPADLVERVGTMLSVPTRDEGGVKILEGGGVAAAVAPGGTLLLGNTPLVTERLRPDWKAPKGSSDGLRGRLAALFAEKPFLVFGSDPGEPARAELDRDIGDDVPFLQDVFTAHEFLGVAFHAKGLRWTWVARDVAGVPVAESASKGIVELFQAGQYAVRGLTRLVFAALRSYDNPTAAALLEHEAEIVKLVLDNTGDKPIASKVTADPRTRTVDARLTGASFKQVFPFALVVPAAAGMWFALRTTSAPEPQIYRMEETPTENSPD